MIEFKSLFVWLVIACLIVQLFYFLYYFLRLAVYKSKKSAVHNNEPFSIVICAKNEEANLRKNITSILNQAYFNAKGLPNFEVVLVDDNSEDGTQYFLNEIKDTYPHLHVITLMQEARHIMGKKFPLSMGIKSAKFENLLLTDADCTPASHLWLSQIAASYQNNTGLVLGYGPYKKENAWLNKKIRWETFYTAMQYLSYALAGNPYMGVGRNLSYKKQLFNDNKGFSRHVNLASGDDDLFVNDVANSRNTAICIDPTAFCYSEPKQTTEQWKRQKQRHLSTGRFYQFKHKFSLALFSFSHMLFYVALLLVCVLTPFWYVALIAFALRGLTQFFIFDAVLKKLQERDLSPYIFYFDIYQLWYYVKMFPYLFKKPYKWQ